QPQPQPQSQPQSQPQPQPQTQPQTQPQLTVSRSEQVSTSSRTVIDLDSDRVSGTALGGLPSLALRQTPSTERPQSQNIAGRYSVSQPSVSGFGSGSGSGSGFSLDHVHLHGKCAATLAIIAASSAPAPIRAQPPSETNAAISASDVMPNYSKMKLVDLKRELSALRLPCYGRKSELIDTLTRRWMAAHPAPPGRVSPTSVGSGSRTGSTLQQAPRTVAQPQPLQTASQLPSPSMQPSQTRPSASPSGRPFNQALMASPTAAFSGSTTQMPLRPQLPLSQHASMHLLLLVLLQCWPVLYQHLFKICDCRTGLSPRDSASSRIYDRSAPSQSAPSGSGSGSGSLGLSLGGPRPLSKSTTATAISFASQLNPPPNTQTGASLSSRSAYRSVALAPPAPIAATALRPSDSRPPPASISTSSMSQPASASASASAPAPAPASQHLLSRSRIDAEILISSGSSDNGSDAEPNLSDLEDAAATQGSAGASASTTGATPARIAIEGINARLFDFIKGNEVLYQRVLALEPIDFEELLRLVSKEPTLSMCNSKILVGFLDRYVSGLVLTGYACGCEVYGVCARADAACWDG
ncbi:hypothetical protein BC831DRAFT_441399, partial [Entophlyctis helioformis]